MCFTPTVSFSIFVIEWILGFLVLSRRPSGRFREAYNIAALLLFFLGFYQFTQFMFCTSGDYQLWGTAGFLTYTFLPAMGVHFAYSLAGKWKGSLYGLYFLPAAFSLIAGLTPGFVSVAGCSRYFITARHSWDGLVVWLYVLYYFGFILYTAYFYIAESEKMRKDRKILRAGFLGIMAFTIPTFVLITVFPALNIMFPSVLCEFALLFAIFIFYMIGLIEKSNHT